MFGTLLMSERHFHNSISLLRVEVWVHKTSLIPLLLIHASHDVDMCVRGVDWTHQTSLIPLLFIEIPVTC